MATYVEEYDDSQIHEAEESWKLHVASVEDYFEYNKKFLRGEICASPYHGGPIYDDTKELSAKLIQIHDCGFLTVNGQGPCNEPDCVQIPYLVLVVPQSELDKFVEFLESIDDLFYATEHKTNICKSIVVTRDDDRDFTYIHPDVEEIGDAVGRDFAYLFENWAVVAICGKLDLEEIVLRYFE